MVNATLLRLGLIPTIDGHLRTCPRPISQIGRAGFSTCNLGYYGALYKAVSHTFTEQHCLNCVCPAIHTAAQVQEEGTQTLIVTAVTPYQIGRPPVVPCYTIRLGVPFPVSRLSRTSFALPYYHITVPITDYPSGFGLIKRLDSNLTHSLVGWLATLSDIDIKRPFHLNIVVNLPLPYCANFNRRCFWRAVRICLVT